MNNGWRKVPTVIGALPISVSDAYEMTQARKDAYLNYKREIERDLNLQQSLRDAQWQSSQSQRLAYLDENVIPLMEKWWKNNPEAAAYILSEYQRFQKLLDDAGTAEMGSPEVQSINNDLIDMLFGMSGIMANEWASVSRPSDLGLSRLAMYRFMGIIGGKID